MREPDKPPMWFVVGFMLAWAVAIIGPTAWVIANPVEHEGPRDWHGQEFWGWAD